MRLTPRQARRVRRATERREPDPSEQESELNIVPFLDIVVNLMLFMLATTAAVMAVAQHDVDLPSTCRGCPTQEGLELSITLTEVGVVVASREGVDCRIEGHDYDALGACLAEVHAAHPDEDDVILSAAPAVRYEALVLAMDRAKEAGLSRVRLSAGVR